MKDIISISKKLWQLIVQLFALLLQLTRQIILPGRKRKGNLLNVLFLFYIGIIEHLRHFEHRQFKMADLLQNRLVRKGMMLCTFLLFFLTSFEQTAVYQTSTDDATRVECSYQSIARQLTSAHYNKAIFVQIDSLLKSRAIFIYGNVQKTRHYSFKIYLQNCCLLI